MGLYRVVYTYEDYTNQKCVTPIGCFFEALGFGKVIHGLSVDPFETPWCLVGKRRTAEETEATEGFRAYSIVLLAGSRGMSSS